VTAHPTSEWTLQQFRETLPGDHAYRFVIHDRDTIFSKQWDKRLPRSRAIRELLTSPFRTPLAVPN
jgi:hypothetical protein